MAKAKAQSIETEIPPPVDHTKEGEAVRARRESYRQSRIERTAKRAEFEASLHVDEEKKPKPTDEDADKEAPAPPD